MGAGATGAFGVEQGGGTALWAVRALMRMGNCASMDAKSGWRSMMRSVRVNSGVLGTEDASVRSITLSGPYSGGDH